MTTPAAGRPTFAVIDATAVRGNFALLRAAVSPTVVVLAVVKADAYGHGAVMVAPILEAAGADWLGVATVDEGVELRASGVRKPILVLTGAAAADVPALVEQRLSVAVLHREMARDLAYGLQVLVMEGGASYPFMHVTALALVKAMPHAQHRTLQGQTHEVAVSALAPVLVEFFTANAA